MLAFFQDDLCCPSSICRWLVFRTQTRDFLKSCAKQEPDPSQIRALICGSPILRQPQTPPRLPTCASLQDGIDILVDLTGHTGNNRLGVFACKPAPALQLHRSLPRFSWISYRQRLPHGASHEVCMRDPGTRRAQFGLVQVTLNAIGIPNMI